MTILQSVFLGIIQGLTEFLPVSSSGHLAVLKNIFHIDTGDSLLFELLLHIGTLFVVFFIYRRDIWQLIRECLGMIRDICANIRILSANRTASAAQPRRKIVSSNYRKFVVLILVSTIPTGIIGVLGEKLISDATDTLLIPGICLVITGVLLLVSDRQTDTVKIPRDITYREGIIVGAAQGAATLPGLSRSGTTIAACLMCGFDRALAVKYSFILSIPAILGASLLELKDLGTEMISPSMAAVYAAGMIAAAVVGYFCIRFLQALVQGKKFRYFAYYCFAVGVFAIIGQFIFR